MILSLDILSPVLIAILTAACSGYFGQVRAANIKKEGDREIEILKEKLRQQSSGNESLGKLFKNLEKVVTSRDIADTEADDHINKVREILSAWKHYNRIWSSDDFRDYISARLWLDKNGDLLIDDTLAYVKKRKSLSGKDSDRLKRFEAGLCDYMSWLMVKLERQGRQGVDWDNDKIDRYCNSVPRNYYEEAFGFMVKKLHKLSLREVSSSGLLNFSVPSTLFLYKYSPITEEDSYLITYFLKQVIARLKL